MSKINENKNKSVVQLINPTPQRTIGTDRTQLISIIKTIVFFSYSTNNISSRDPLMENVSNIKEKKNIAAYLLMRLTLKYMKKIYENRCKCLIEKIGRILWILSRKCFIRIIVQRSVHDYRQKHKTVIQIQIIFFRYIMKETEYCFVHE